MQNGADVSSGHTGGYNTYMDKYMHPQNSGQAQDWEKYTKQIPEDYSKYAEQRYGDDYSKYSSERGAPSHASDYSKYMEKYAGDSQSADYDKYMKQYAGDYSKYMMQPITLQGSVRSDDAKQQAVNRGANPKSVEKKTPVQPAALAAQEPTQPKGKVEKMLAELIERRSGISGLLVAMGIVSGVFSVVVHKWRYG